MSHPITILMPSRMAGNENSRFRACLSSLADHADDATNFELLIKFDDDDQDLPTLLGIVKEFRNRFSIRHIVTSRASGYGDLHKAALDLLRIADANSVLFWGLGDDCVVQSPGWDTKMLARCHDYDDGLFVLHFRQDARFRAIHGG